MKITEILTENNYEQFMYLVDTGYKFQIRNHDQISSTMDKSEWIQIYGGYTVQEVIDSLNEESKY